MSSLCAYVLTKIPGDPSQKLLIVEDTPVTATFLNFTQHLPDMQRRIDTILTATDPLDDFDDKAITGAFFISRWEGIACKEGPGLGPCCIGDDENPADPILVFLKSSNSKGKQAALITQDHDVGNVKIDDPAGTPAEATTENGKPS
ncbi:MAG: hypothetical protein ASARMPREDX12_007200 [Alectoria sarmentosa]|nr:MAG: hypothetical protein ASARMPREDX12_007200 [Alectoria sarmentosa]